MRALDRQHRSYKRLRAQFRARCVASNAPCHLCNNELGPIDYHARANTPMAFDVDHLIPAAQRPDLAYETSLWRASHHRCNIGGYRGRHVLEALGIKTEITEGGQWCRPSW
jgi:hypothetical protein